MAFLAPIPVNRLPETLSNSRQFLTTPTCTAVPRPASKKARRSLDHVDVPAFSSYINEHANTPALTRRLPTTLQINIGLTCNLACRHCHVESSPSRRETMSATVANRLLHLASRTPSLKTADLTGGAPELHEQFRPLVRGFAQMGLQVIDRSNLVVLDEQPDLAHFLAEQRVKVIASLPCYTVTNVEKQRGDGVFDASIRALQQLNRLGYGVEGSGLELDLVYNPLGASLPPVQEELERDYRRELKRAFGIVFSRLICITNMPIKRFADDLVRQGRLEEYMQLLVRSFNSDTVESVMCRDMVHVAWDGRFYDCDFNYALDMTLPVQRKGDIYMPEGLCVFDVDAFDELEGKKIRTDKHCYGCTAGRGSSCGGSLS